MLDALFVAFGGMAFLCGFLLVLIFIGYSTSMLVDVINEVIPKIVELKRSLKK